MSEKAYLVKGTAAVRLAGVARIVDIDGNVIKDRDLAELGEITIRLESTQSFSLTDYDQCGLTFRISDVFADEIHGG